jgi:hypothetical protein
MKRKSQKLLVLNRLIVFQGESNNFGTLSVGTMNGLAAMPEMSLCFPLGHTGGKGSLGPTVTIAVKGYSRNFRPQTYLPKVTRSFVFG